MNQHPEQSAEFLLGRLANEQETNRKLRALLTRAADALAGMDPKWEGDWSKLIAELREAAE